MKARSRWVISVGVLDNNEVKEGYVLIIKPTEGLLIRETVVSNSNGTCHIYAINTNVEYLEVQIGVYEIIPIEYYHLPGDELGAYSIDENYFHFISSQKGGPHWKEKIQGRN